MRRSVVWTEQAESQLIALPPSEASDVLNAVETFAEHGRGFVRRMIPSDEYRLYTSQWIVAFIVIDDAIVVAELKPRQ